MLYASLKTLHLLSIVLWVGGMAFVLLFLRPALGTLQPPARLTLMNEVLRRFFGAVLAAIAVVLVSGLWMMGLYAGHGSPMPMGWMLMATLGVVMMAIFGHVRFVLYKRLTHAVASSEWSAGGAALASIRLWVTANLVLGLAAIGAALL